MTTPEFWSLPKMLSCKCLSISSVLCTLDLWLIVVVCFSYRVCEMLYERKRQFSKVLSCYFRDSSREVGNEKPCSTTGNLTNYRAFLLLLFHFIDKIYTFLQFWFGSSSLVSLFYSRFRYFDAFINFYW